MLHGFMKQRLSLLKRTDKITSHNTAYPVSLRFTQMLRTSDDAETLCDMASQPHRTTRNIRLTPILLSQHRIFRNVICHLLNFFILNVNIYEKKHIPLRFTNIATRWL